MSARQKQFYERILNVIRQYQMIETDECVLVGVSGGIDSVVLLYALHHLREHLGSRLHVAHLNHQLRGQEAVRDAEFVRRFAEQLDIPCTIESRDVPALIRREKLSPQDAARQVRYRFFESLAKLVNAQKIATAHNADDQAETVLLGIIRGVGIHGLGGIRPVLNGKIIRPLLTTPRDQIETFAQTEGLDYVFDSSNSSRKYLRNAIRLDLLPLLKQKFTPAIVRRLTAYAQLFQEDAFFIDKIAGERYIQICQSADGAVKIHLELFTREDVTIQRALIYKAFEEITGSRHGLETIHARSVVELFTQKKTGKRLSLPGGVIAVRSYIWGYLQRDMYLPPHRSVSPRSLVIPGKTVFGDFCIETNILETRTPGSYIRGGTKTGDELIQHVDYDRVAFPITVRFRLSGDCFRPLGIRGKKRLKKFFIDRKVPRDKRNTIPLFTDNNGIIWVVGYSIDDRVKITKSTKKILTCQVYKQIKG
jgi:tRNA(Ile)-lysidine synthase